MEKNNEEVKILSKNELKKQMFSEFKVWLSHMGIKHEDWPDETWDFLSLSLLWSNFEEMVMQQLYKEQMESENRKKTILGH